MAMIKPASVDEYFANIASADLRQALSHVREVLREALPESAEVISYGMPAFKTSKVVLCYAAFKAHCFLFPGAILSRFAAEAEGFKTSKGTIQFTPEHPLPDSLIRAIVQARLDDIAAPKEKRK